MLYAYADLCAVLVRPAAFFHRLRHLVHLPFFIASSNLRCLYHQTVLWCLLNECMRRAVCCAVQACTNLNISRVRYANCVCGRGLQKSEEMKRMKDRIAHMEPSHRDKNMLFVRHFIIFPDAHDLFCVSARHKPKSAR